MMKIILEIAMKLLFARSSVFVIVAAVVVIDGYISRTIIQLRCWMKANSPGQTPMKQNSQQHEKLLSVTGK